MVRIIAEDELMLLRTWHEDDAMTLYWLNSNDNVLKYTGDVAFADEAAARNFILNYDHFTRYNCGRWMVVLKADDRCIGWCGVKYHNDKDYYDLGFRLMEDCWGNGYATHAALLAMEYCKNQLGLTILKARAMTDNMASIRVLKKLGFAIKEAAEEEGTLWQYFEKIL